ncbi:choice-of-anchor P family protein [Nonomuraea sp. NPDC047897]|uniref:choice-of-anchor P family protein n=1 Tax=Nonomuraea sp. NPDC047897 TaxID=3364346 RepID=UPI0037143B4E
MRDGQVAGHCRGALRRALTGVAVVALSTASVVAAQSTTAMAASPLTGVPQAPEVVFTETFENGQGADPIVVTDYTGPAPVHQTYTADPAWLTACNGWVASQQNPSAPPAGSGCGGWWGSVKQLAGTLGTWAGGDPATNHAVTAYTNADPGPNKTQLEAVTPVAIGASNRFLTFSVDAAEVNCYANHAKMGFYLLDGPKAVPTFTTPIEPCANPGTTVGGIAVGTYTSDSPVLFGGSTVGLRLVNFQASGYGNDAAFDNVRILDVTPQLDVAYSPASAEVGTDATLTFTITNTSELAVKNGWSFTERLPAGLTVAAAPATDCAAPEMTAAQGGGLISATGTLPAGKTSCTVRVAVTSARAGTYQTCAADLVAHAGLNPPGCAAVTFVPPVLAFDAHAHGGRVTTRLLTVGPLVPSDITCTETPDVDRHTLAKATLPGLGSLGVIRTEASGSVDPAGRRTATATARTAHLRLLGGLVTADEIIATAKAQGDDAGRVNASGQVTLTNLKVNGVTITDTQANVAIDIPLVAKIVINEQVTSPDGIAVNALHIRTPAGADIVIGHARAALTLPGKPCPTY